MTSFVTDVLITAGKLEKVNLHEKISEIQKEITKLKYDVKDLMDDNYVEFTSKLKRDQHLVVKGEKLLEEMNSLQKKIDDQVKVELSGSTKELKSLSEALKESNMMLQLSNQLLTIHESIKSVKSYQDEKRYVDVAKTLCHIYSIINNPQTDLRDLDIYTAIEAECLNLYTSFLSNTSMLLYERICWTGIDDKDAKIVTLSVKDEFDDMQELIQGLHYIDNLSSHLHRFSTTLMDYIINPIINDDCSVYVVDEKVFTVEVLNKKKSPTYKSVLYNLELLFKFLHQYFNMIIYDDETFLKQIQPHLLERLSASLTADCISRIIPTSNADLKNFTPIVQAINDFQYFLVKIGFITNDQLFLSEYTKNIDQLFINKVCQDLLSKARNIMKKDLHDCIIYEPQESLEFPEDTYDYDKLKIEKKLSDNTFQLPKCQISKNTKEILDLARNILDEACFSSDSCAVRLFYTCRNIFEMYTGIVPEHHRKFLETIPQQVAVFHNNCMYLAHHLITLGHEYRDKLPESLHKLNLTFADQVLVLREVGSTCFLEHMKYQRNIIFDILKESGLSALGQTSELHPSTERAMRQCIRQLELLKTVWLDVLPVNIYCRTVGCIMNSMVEDLIIRVVSVEDIPADVATELVALFNMIVKRAPQTFPEPQNIHQHVRKWEKFLELIHVLGASLKEIEIRWDSGKGPLAREFTAPQVKQLIRALFQNTERRSNLLASIK
ncbi:zeste-white 10 kinetochore protein [Megachile rotundata]|uniref:zeste-white 10 kinetochore protein n=1 Tax=Megachile rotundata TaxID=143995 RepID=UPI000258E864|nr:PREDICTED: centromere/kinetochore protein zw10 homolog [Megachile rotundata]XP_012142032.1 PREDICTED: centromere/kinetochore protein zw10 homolog [Megachile rotundata]XP_012142033.1 PREDICTED: centromere/kinetochore protein zw10 homolog [Megachile rotundata]